MTLTTEQKIILIDTCNVMINREATSDHSENLREVAKIALSTLTANREAQPVYQYRMRNPYNGQVTDWETIKPEQVDFILKETIAANVEFRIIAAPPAPAPAVQDEIDSFADQVIGTKDKIIRLPAPMPVPLEGIRVYLNADTIISYLEKQGYIVEVSRE
ncbi:MULTISPECIES: hypothetical protein [Serratia]|uniref:hypothetical protein n=1 Tax=Serratia TaxID=613 RepID=UPI0008A85D08|nr:hypothetical protein [Serratia marcescens]APS33795.1 hypothetical protein RN42_08045 [Serratia marcescens]OHT41616.1 hypothetical protein BGV45_19345 [Serratia marcescens]OHT42644.1 hypothetical protein BGV46_19565 [Serratia marcescens]